jgi:hypothetical protein
MLARPPRRDPCRHRPTVSRGYRLRPRDVPRRARGRRLRNWRLEPRDARTRRGEHEGFRWETHAKKLRGRGDGAAEKRFGADLAIEIEVSDSLGQSTQKKTLFAQAKKEWEGKDALLGDQAEKLVDLPGGGIVIDYWPDRFRAINAAEAVRAEGNARQVGKDAFRDLGEMLGEDFLNCRIGSTGVHYDASHDQLVIAHGSELRFVKFVLARRVRTDIWPTRRRTGRK